MRRRYRNRRYRKLGLFSFITDVFMTFFSDSYDSRKRPYGLGRNDDYTMCYEDEMQKRSQKAFSNAMVNDINKKKAVEAHCEELKYEQSKNYTYKTDSSSKMDSL